MSFPASYGGALCTLQIQARKNDSFRLLVFASRDVHSHAAFHESVDLPAGVPTEAPWLRCGDSPLHFCLFVNTLDADGLYTQTLLAWGHYSSEAVCNLTDVKGKYQARLVFTQRIKCIAEPSSSPSMVAKLAEMILNQVRQAYGCVKWAWTADAPSSCTRAATTWACTAGTI